MCTDGSGLHVFAKCEKVFLSLDFLLLNNSITVSSFCSVKKVFIWCKLLDNLTVNRCEMFPGCCFSSALCCEAVGVVEVRALFARLLLNLLSTLRDVFQVWNSCNGMFPLGKCDDTPHLQLSCRATLMLRLVLSENGRRESYIRSRVELLPSLLFRTRSPFISPTRETDFPAPCVKQSLLCVCHLNSFKEETLFALTFYYETMNTWDIVSFLYFTDFRCN